MKLGKSEWETGGGATGRQRRESEREGEREVGEKKMILAGRFLDLQISHV